MSFIKHKLHIKSLSKDEIMNKIKTNEFSEFCTVIETFNISGSELLELNEYGIRMKIGNQVERKTLQRFQAFVHDVQTTPDKVFPLECANGKKPASFRNKPDVKAKPLLQRADSQKFMQDLERKFQDTRNSKSARNSEFDETNKIDANMNGFRNETNETSACNRTSKTDSATIHVDKDINTTLLLEEEHFPTYDRPRSYKNQSQEFPPSEISQTRISSSGSNDDKAPKVRQKLKNGTSNNKDAPVIENTRPDSKHQENSPTPETIDDMTEYCEIETELGDLEEEKRFSNNDRPEYDHTRITNLDPPELPDRPAEMMKLSNKVKKVKASSGKRVYKKQHSIDESDPLVAPNPQNMPVYEELPALKKSEPPMLPAMEADDTTYVQPVSVKSPMYQLRRHVSFRNVTRATGSYLLEKTPIGTYLLRVSTQARFFAVLMIKGNIKVQNIPISYDPTTMEYSLEPEHPGTNANRSTFYSLDDLLAYYTTHIVNGDTLLEANELPSSVMGQKEEDVFVLHQHPFFRDVTRETGQQLLENTPIGSYLLRVSRDKCYFAVLMINGMVKIQNVPIDFNPTKVEYSLVHEEEIYRNKFNTMNNLLDFYASYAINADTLLESALNEVPEA